MGTATSRVPLTQSHTPAARDHDQAHGNLEPALDDLALPVGDSPLVFGNQALGLASASAPPQDTTGSNSQPPLPDPNPPHPTSPGIAPASVSLTTTKKILTPNDVMEGYKLKTLAELCALQQTHICYEKLNLAIKIEAQNLYFEYQRKQLLL
ncbi:hypothetical protein PSHT_12380 [Puccinia striiformis]|uniref:Uncharacterized protein n=2 Tax=Puccinia striiformis TaxID=27350 RepID=A0A2S4UWX9_9BASI|nr:hypothetical protein PSHT_12380 [Puccinia striiformis]